VERGAGPSFRKGNDADLIYHVVCLFLSVCALSPPRFRLDGLWELQG
jgi:hypothetical protein